MNVFFRLLPAADRETIVGDLLEDADFRGVAGLQRTVWLAGECSAIAVGLTLERVRSWFVAANVREVVSGLAIDGRGALRGHASEIVLRGLALCGSVAALAFAVEVLVRTLLTASGY
jgi:hypothetical protein